MGVFQDFVDVEAIGQILPEVSFNLYSFESHTPEATMFVWTCGETKWLIPIEEGGFVIVNSEQSCAVISGVVKPGKTLCHFFYCPPPWDPEYDSCIDNCMSDPYPIEVGPTCESLCGKMKQIDPSFDYVGCMDACNQD